MGFFGGLIAQGAMELIGMSRDKKIDNLTIKIVEKHRAFLKLNNSSNPELEEFAVEYKEWYNKALKNIK